MRGGAEQHTEARNEQRGQTSFVLVPRQAAWWVCKCRLALTVVCLVTDQSISLSSLVLSAWTAAAL